MLAIATALCAIGACAKPEMNGRANDFDATKAQPAKEGKSVQTAKLSEGKYDASDAYDTERGVDFIWNPVSKRGHLLVTVEPVQVEAARKWLRENITEFMHKRDPEMFGNMKFKTGNEEPTKKEADGKIRLDINFFAED